MRCRCGNRRRNARRCCIRPAPRIAAGYSLAATPSAYSSTAPILGHAAEVAADLRARAGSRPIQVFAGATVVTAATEAEARDRLEEYRRHTNAEGALAHAAASLGIDFARYDMDEPIDASDSQAIQSNIESIAASLGVGWTKRMLIDRFILGSRQTPIVGSPSQVADALQRWVDEADVDGFNLSRTVIPECLEDFIDLIVPALQDRGVFKSGVFVWERIGRNCSVQGIGCLTIIRRREKDG